MSAIDPYYDPKKNKSIVFFSSSSWNDTKQLRDFDIRELLVSYHYIRKNKATFENMMRELHEIGGIFMADSGVFSFVNGFQPEDMEKATHPEFWLEYLEEYVNWLWEWKDYIYVAANFDLDRFVGSRQVYKWNKQYFEPLEKAGLQIVYVAHDTPSDPIALRQFEYYCRRYKYVGVNQALKPFARKYYELAEKYRVRVHGFAWTELELLKKYPFFSVDSTTWLGGARYGTTYTYDGKNFKTVPYYHKSRVRKARKLLYEENDVPFEHILGKEKPYWVNRINLIGWVGFRKEYLKYANLKLKNLTVDRYDPRRKSKAKD